MTLTWSTAKEVLCDRDSATETSITANLRLCNLNLPLWRTWKRLFHLQQTSAPHLRPSQAGDRIRARSDEANEKSMDIISARHTKDEWRPTTVRYKRLPTPHDDWNSARSSGPSVSSFGHLTRWKGRAMFHSFQRFELVDQLPSLFGQYTDDHLQISLL